MLFQMVQFQNIIFHKSLCNFKWYFEWLPFENCKTLSKTARFQIVFPTVLCRKQAKKPFKKQFPIYTNLLFLNGRSRTALL